MQEKPDNPFEPRFAPVGLFERLMQATPSSPERRRSAGASWRRMLVARLQTPAPDGQIEWVGSRDGGVIAVPRDG